MSLPAIRLAGATLAQGGRTVLAGVDLRIEAGEFVGLLGANGAGKTTLLRAILGLLRPTAGRVEVLGASARRGDRRIGYLPQQRGLADLAFTGRTVMTAVLDGHRWGLPLTGASGRRAVERALDLVQADALADRPLGTLSGGERQRLALAQALLGAPQVLLLDEPLASLDPHHQDATVELVRRLQQRLGITVVFSAHELTPLLGALDRVLCVGQGQAVIGDVEEVITGPILSRLYGAALDVIHYEGRLVVVGGKRKEAVLF